MGNTVRGSFLPADPNDEPIIRPRDSPWKQEATLSVIVLKKSDIPDNGAIVVPASAWLKIAVFRVGDRLAAIDNRCPHAGYDLWDQEGGDFNGTTIRCIWHGFKIDIWKGKGQDGTPHPTFPVTLVGDEVHLVVPDDI